MKSKSKGLVTYSQVHHKPFSYKNRKTAEISAQNG